MCLMKILSQVVTLYQETTEFRIFIRHIQDSRHTGQQKCEDIVLGRSNRPYFSGLLYFEVYYKAFTIFGCKTDY